MSVEETRAHLARRIRQAIDESGIAFSTAQKSQLDELSNHIADATLLEFDAMLGNMMRSGQLAGSAAGSTGATPAAPATPAAQGEPAPEEVLWQGRPFLSLGQHYTVTTERVRMITGLIGKDTEDIELIRIQDVDHTQGLTERLLNIGDVFLHSTDRTDPNAVLRNVTDPVQVHEIIRRAIMEARRRYPFAFRQEI